jgi:hypothetical protein
MRVQNERETCAGLYREATEMHVTGLGARGGEVPWKCSEGGAELAEGRRMSEVKGAERVGEENHKRERDSYL